MVFSDDKSFVPAVVDEIKDIKNDDELLKNTIKDWYEKTRTQGMKLGAQMICVAGANVMEKHLGKKSKPSLRDYERMTAELTKIFTVPLKNRTEQNNSGEDDDRAAE